LVSECRRHPDKWLNANLVVRMCIYVYRDHHQQLRDAAIEQAKREFDTLEEAAHIR